MRKRERGGNEERGAKNGGLAESRKRGTRRDGEKIPFFPGGRRRGRRIRRGTNNGGRTGEGEGGRGRDPKGARGEGGEDSRGKGMRMRED